VSHYSIKYITAAKLHGATGAWATKDCLPPALPFGFAGGLEERMGRKSWMMERAETGKAGCKGGLILEGSGIWPQFF